MNSTQLRSYLSELVEVDDDVVLLMIGTNNRKLFNEILDCWNKKEVSYKNECAALFSKILSEMYKDNQPAYKNKKIGESIIYMEKNCLRSDFSLAVTAAKSFMSEPYYRR